eukprot:391750-Rhodomonas_salina.2
MERTRVVSDRGMARACGDQNLMQDLGEHLLWPSHQHARRSHTRAPPLALTDTQKCTQESAERHGYANAQGSKMAFSLSLSSNSLSLC